MNMFNIPHLKCVCTIITRGGLISRPSFGLRFTSGSIKNDISLQDKKVEIPQPKLRFSGSNKNRRTIGPFGWVLMLVPVVTFCLGTWQVRRKAWKEQLIAELRKRRDTQPRTLPDHLDSTLLIALEYYPIHVRGYFVHDLEMFLGPRTLLVRGDAVTEGGLMSQQQGGARHGYLLVTPFQLEGRKERILVNRGWVPASYVKSKRRPQINMKSEDLIGLIRLTERRPLFMPQQNRGGGDTPHQIWMYRDIEQMALRAGDDCAHVFLDATDDHLMQSLSQSQGGRGDAAVVAAPIANQTRVTLRNEHLSYVLTWYGLSAATATLWYRHFLIKR